MQVALPQRILALASLLAAIWCCASHAYGWAVMAALAALAWWNLDRLLDR